MSEKIYRADFLWLLCEDGNIQEAGYEFANGLSQEYQEQWWNILVERIRARALADAKAAVDRFDYLFDNIGHERIDKIKAAIEALEVKP